MEMTWENLSPNGRGGGGGVGGILPYNYVYELLNSASDSKAHRVYTIAINLYWCDYMYKSRCIICVEVENIAPSGLDV